MLHVSPAYGHVEHDSVSLASCQEDLERESVASYPIPAGKEVREVPTTVQELEPELTID